jgi:hypothetical protein
VVKVYPTIGSNNVTIQTAVNENLRVEVIDLLGKRMMSIVLGSENTCVDVSSVKRGLYFINIFNSKGFLIGAQKILKIQD